MRRGLRPGTFGGKGGGEKELPKALPLPGPSKGKGDRSSGRMRVGAILMAKYLELRRGCELNIRKNRSIAFLPQKEKKERQHYGIRDRLRKSQGKSILCQ